VVLFMMKAKDLMNREVYSLKPTDTVYQARELMLEKRIRHIPIVNDQGEFVGLLTKRDVLAVSVSALADINASERNELESAIPIGEVMTTDLMVAEEETDLREAAQFMLDEKHGCLPVLRNRRLVGIITEADFVRLAIYLMEKLTSPESENSST